MKTIHIVSHTHWDREWYLTFQQFRLKLVHLVDGLLDILRRDAGYRHFMLDGQTIVLDDYLQMRPDREAELRHYIREGRIIIGPWHILPDMFLAGPEAHIRNLLEGGRTARRFGPEMLIGYMPDSFGHIGQMPQILRGFGIEAAALWRGAGDAPCEFRWQAPNGAQVFMAHLRNSYSNGSALPAGNPRQFAEMIGQQSRLLSANAAADDLLIMYGTDHMEPDPQTAAAIAYANSVLSGAKVIHSTLAAYIAAVQSGVQADSLPVVKGELRSALRSPLLPNVLSTRIWIKQENHACETLLEKWVEPYSVFADRVAHQACTNNRRIQRPAALIRQTWRLLMENHPHDSICGCSIDQVHTEMKVRFGQVRQICEELTHQSLTALAEAAATGNGTWPGPGKAAAAIVVFNPLAHPRTDLVQADIDLPAGAGAFDLVDATGAIIPHEVLGSESVELANIILDRKALKEALPMVSTGRITGMGVQAFTVQRTAQTAHLELLLSGSEPDAASWQQGMRALTALLDDAEVTSFHVRARTLPSGKILFAAPDIPGLGYRTFGIRLRELPQSGAVHINPLMRALVQLAHTAPGQWLMKRFTREPAPRPPYRIENEFFIVQAETDSTLTLVDKRDESVYRGLNRFVDTGDRGDEYNYCPVASETGQGITKVKLTSVRINNNAVRKTIVLAVKMAIPEQLNRDRKSRSGKTVLLDIITRISLAPGIPRLDIHTEITNNGRDHRLRVHFPTGLDCTAQNHPVNIDYDGHYEIIRRPLFKAVPPEAVKSGTWAEQPRPEVPERAFTDVADETRGLMIANRGLPEVEVLQQPDGKAAIALTLLRCVGWLSRDDLAVRPGHAGPGMETPAAQLPGTWEFDYSVIPHTQGQTIPRQLAYSFETPLRAVATSLHNGVLPTAGSFITVASEGFVISGIKETDDGRGWLVRGYNPSGTPVPVSIKPGVPCKSAEFTDLAERKIGNAEVSPGCVVTFTSAPYEIVTIVFND